MLKSLTLVYVDAKNLEMFPAYLNLHDPICWCFFHGMKKAALVKTMEFMPSNTFLKREKTSM